MRASKTGKEALSQPRQRKTPVAAPENAGIDAAIREKCVIAPGPSSQSV